MNLITENTGISIALFISAGGVIWWASQMSAKIDMLLNLAKDAAKAHDDLKVRVENSEREIALLKGKVK